jgi:hypothetical protein
MLSSFRLRFAILVARRPRAVFYHRERVTQSQKGQFQPAPALKLPPRRGRQGRALQRGRFAFDVVHARLDGAQHRAGSNRSAREHALINGPLRASFHEILLSKTGSERFREKTEAKRMTTSTETQFRTFFFPMD